MSWNFDLQLIFNSLIKSFSVVKTSFHSGHDCIQEHQMLGTRCCVSSTAAHKRISVLSPHGVRSLLLLIILLFKWMFCLKSQSVFFFTVICIFYFFQDYMILIPNLGHRVSRVRTNFFSGEKTIISFVSSHFELGYLLLFKLVCTFFLIQESMFSYLSSRLYLRSCFLCLGPEFADI